MTHPRTPERAELLTRMWTDGDTVVDICRTLKMGKSAMNEYRMHLGLPERNRLPVKNEWPEEHAADVKVRWARGESATEIARHYPGRTRLAVIGLIHRSGLVGRGVAATPMLKAPSVRQGSANPRGAHRTAPRPGPQKKTPAVFGKVHATTHAEAVTKRQQAAVAGAQHIRGFHFPANDDAIPLIERRFGQCSWPVGTPERPADQLCCGQRVIGDRTKSTATYCDMHRMRAAPAGVPSVRTLTRSVRRAA